MSFGSIISIIKGIIELILKVPEWIDQWVRSQARDDAEKRQKQVDDGVKKAREAKTIEEKANAACDIQKALDPDSTCGTKLSDQ